MRFYLSLLGFFLVTQPAIAQDLQEKLDAKKSAFEQSAEPQKIKDYDEGIELVRQSGVLDDALNVGDSAPNFTLPDAAENNVTLADLLADGPVVMVWYRGEWCPYCNIQLEDIQNHIGAFNEAGAQVVAISPETPDRGWALQDRMAIDFHVLSDAKSAVGKQYGVVYELPPKIAGYYQDAFDLHGKNADDSNLLPLAAAYVIDQQGVITYAYLDADYRKRAETSVLLEEVKALDNRAE
jgi:peroxiredoxin